LIASFRYGFAADRKSGRSVAEDFPAMRLVSIAAARRNTSQPAEARPDLFPGASVATRPLAVNDEIRRLVAGGGDAGMTSYGYVGEPGRSQISP